MSPTVEELGDVVQTSQLSPMVQVWRQGTVGKWIKSADQRLDAYCRIALRNGGVQIAFVQTAPPDGTPLSASDQESLQQLLGIRKNYWSRVDRASSGRFGVRRWEDATGNDVFTLTSEFLINEAVHRPPPVSQPIPKGHLTIERKWNSVGLITRWSSDGSFLTVLPMVAADVQDNILWTLEDRDEVVCHRDPFAVLAIVFESIISGYNTAVWSWRDHVRYFETRRKMDDAAPESKYEMMHELARNAINCSETVASGQKVLESIIEEHSIWLDDHGPKCSQDIVAFGRSQEVSRCLRGHRALLNGISLRSTCLEERLKNEISLAFTAVNQQQSKASVLIAEAAQSDSASTKMISILGLVFFPLTVVSSIFSTTFFTNATVSDSSGVTNQVWQMSDRFWIYWAFSIPLTIITLVAWVCYYRYILRPKLRFQDDILASSSPISQVELLDHELKPALSSSRWSPRGPRQRQGVSDVEAGKDKNELTTDCERC
ncbi:hypothetical protein K461DRAFT_110508 [Myriangium duriaei CBS 260.36]|uniref:Uncharacterized protein n=1 Tax=Myriangium duriaei CBS 260.36 TaxID=1168546 RepID=A0A9P4J545_9PEZI|nr:hypothetical protein K461DRAFT_110508 [Myriangium duriaei CBS 260.36]